jgi:pectin methylesterase-like acyl-CoA thioesterase
MDKAANARHSPRVRIALALVHWLTVAFMWGGGSASSGSVGATAPVVLFPRDGATNICPDTPLRITFAAPPELGGGGTIQIVDSADGTVLETVDISVPLATKTIGGLDGFKYFPVVISGNDVTIHLRDRALAYNKTYVVNISPTVLAHVGAPPKTWRFTTKAAAPPAAAKKLIVAADGTGDFSTVQGALDFIPTGNTKPRTIFVRKGTYAEIIFVADKHGITLRGEDRVDSIITYANNEKFNAAGNPYAVAGANPSDAAVTRRDAIYRRAVFTAHRVNDLVIANLTIRNTTPSGGSQAEAIILNGTASARAILKDLNLISTQDTLQINGQAYVTNCTIEGDVDFMWGRGPVFFESCVCRSNRSKGYYTQVRNSGANHGFVFVRCTFVGMPGVVDNYLSRIQPRRFPDSEVVLIDSVLGTSVIPVLWQLQDVPGGTDGGVAAAGTNNVHFWEFNSRDEARAPVAVGARHAISRQLKTPDDAVLISNYRNPTFVLGNNWNPKAAPIFADHASR